MKIIDLKLIRELKAEDFLRLGGKNSSAFLFSEEVHCHVLLVTKKYWRRFYYGFT